jgi:glycosyltransferase involved in cell wall biosynthesis
VKSGKKRLLFVIPAMTGGGAERVCLNILNYLDYTRYSVMLVCFNMEGVYLKKIPPDVLMVNLYKKNRYDFFRMIRGLRHEIKQFRAEVVMSFMHYTNIVAALAVFPMLPKPGLIVCEHNYPPKYLPKVRFGFIKRVLMRFAYRKADQVVVISSPIQDYIVKSFNLPKSRVTLIPNPIPVAAIEKDAREPLKHPLFNSKEEPWFVACGRLTEQKRFDRLLEAFAIVSGQIRSRLINLGQCQELFKI